MDLFREYSKTGRKPKRESRYAPILASTGAFALAMIWLALRVMYDRDAPYAQWPTLVSLAPIAAAVLIFFLGRFMSRAASIIIAISAMTFSLIVDLALWFIAANHDSGAILQNVYTWASVGEMKIDFAFRIDALTAILAAAALASGILCGVFASGVSPDKRTHNRALVFICLFEAALMIALSAANLPVFFTGYSALTLCSYLLIGLMRRDDESRLASRWQISLNVIGDMLLMSGMLMLLAQFGSIEMSEMGLWASMMNRYWLLPALLLILIGLAIKSGLWPFSTATALAARLDPLPNALLLSAGPALLSVYVLLRFQTLLLYTPEVMTVAAVMGVVSAFMCILLALAQRDLARSLAYAAMSQYGFAFAAIGFGAFVAAALHMLAFSVCMLSLMLGCGLLVHITGGERNIYRLSQIGLRFAPVRYAMFLSLIALAGFPFALYFTRGQIIAAALSVEIGPASWLAVPLGIILALVSCLTAFLAFRLYYTVFASPALMARKPMPFSAGLPLLVATILCAAAAVLQAPSHEGSLIADLLFDALEDPPQLMHLGGFNTFGLLLSITATLLGFIAARKTFLGQGPLREPTRESEGLPKLFENELYIDHALYRAFSKPLVDFGRILGNFADNWIVESVVVRSSAWLARTAGLGLRYIQSGNVQTYLLLSLAGFFLLCLWLWQTGILTG